MSKLLIVDNSAEILEIMKHILERAGYTVKTLTKSDTIYQEISDFNPDVLILDIFLADGDGREICRNLRMKANTAHLGILAFSASHTTLENYKSFFADDFLEKPFEIKVLKEKIASLLHLVEYRKKNLIQPNI